MDDWLHRADLPERMITTRLASLDESGALVVDCHDANNRYRIPHFEFGFEAPTEHLAIICAVITGPSNDTIGIASIRRAEHWMKVASDAAKTEQDLHRANVLAATAKTIQVRLHDGRESVLSLDGHSRQFSKGEKVNVRLMPLNPWTNHFEIQLEDDSDQILREYPKGREIRVEIKAIIPQGAFASDGTATGFIQRSDLDLIARRLGRDMDEGDIIDAVVRTQNLKQKRLVFGPTDLDRSFLFANFIRRHRIGDTVQATITHVINLGLIAICDHQPILVDISNTSKTKTQVVSRPEEAAGRTVMCEIVSIDVHRHRVSARLISELHGVNQ